MDALLFLVIMVAALAVAAVVIGRAQRTPSPDNPTRPPPGEHAVDAVDADDPRDRPAGPGSSLDAPHSSELQPGEARDPSADGGDVARPSGGPGGEPGPADR